MAFNKITDTLNVHQSRATRPTESAPVLKALFDQDVNTVKTRHNELVDAMNSTTDSASGMDNIGMTPIAGVTATTPQGVLEEFKANDGQNVKLTGNQTIAGTKTFSSSPVVPAPTADTHASTKKYIDDLDVANVKKTGNQTISDTKTFSSNVVVPSTPISATHATSKNYVDVLDAQNVKLTGAQTINGVKTFNTPPEVPTDPVTANDLTRKIYVDTTISQAVSGITPNYVQLLFTLTHNLDKYPFFSTIGCIGAAGCGGAGEYGAGGSNGTTQPNELEHLSRDAMKISIPESIAYGDEELAQFDSDEYLITFGTEAFSLHATIY